MRSTHLPPLLAILLVVFTAPTVQAQVQPYATNDGGGFRNILPPGSNGFANGAQLAAFLSFGTRPPHNDDQLAMYGDLVYAVPGLGAGDLDRFYKDATFGVRDGDVERSYSPRADVTILRDSRFGVPHIYGTTREGTMFGIGYATAEDRLFFIDALRNAGRAQLAAFAGGSAGNRAMDREQWLLTPYTEADLERQIAQGEQIFGAEGTAVRRDGEAYVAGINAYITEAKLDAGKLPGEYPALGHPEGPQPWKLTDVIAIAGLVGGIFGKGGGGELGAAQLYTDFVHRFGRRVGARLYADWRSADDPEAVNTVHGRSFPHLVPPKKPLGMALPDRGSLRNWETAPAAGAHAAARSQTGLFGNGGLRSAFPGSSSNALLVSARESQSGKPLAVFGPQTGYFAPQILMEQDVHGPGIDARGVAFPGTNLYVQLGRGRDYAWSATSAGNDNIDTFALDLCEPGGGKPTMESRSYMFRGACTEFERLERVNSWQPSAGDATPAGTDRLLALRSKLGIVVAFATVKGKPVAYTKLRSTYFHEIDSAAGFKDLNDPAKTRGALDFQRHAARIGYTFNWFYADHSAIAYYNSGDLPVRSKRIHPDFPVAAKYEWRNYDPALVRADYEPVAAHPRTIDQDFISNWNNKQAAHYRADDGRLNYGPVDRGQLLEDRLRAGIAGARKMTLVEVVEAMESAGTVDLRGDKVLPLALAVLGKPADRALADALAKLRSWHLDGSHRRDRDRDGRYEHSEAIAIMDAWWPLWVRTEFEGVLGRSLFRRVLSIQGIDNEPNNHGAHLGSAYDDGWYGFVSKDLRMLLRRKVRGPWLRTYCGGGSLRLCRRDLEDTLGEALGIVARGELYRGDADCVAEGRDGDQLCWDSVRHRATGGVSQPGIHWINRPTFQQVVEVQGKAPR